MVGKALAEILNKILAARMSFIGTKNGFFAARKALVEILNGFLVTRMSFIGTRNGFFAARKALVEILNRFPTVWKALRKIGN